jgi:hypothetical protein
MLAGTLDENVRNQIQLHRHDSWQIEALTKSQL